MRSRSRPTSRHRRGFTLIELMVVMAIIATLLTIAAPRYFEHLDRAREASLRETLAVTREAIDKFHADHDRYPATLQELVDRRYLRQLPLDPITDSRETWVLQAPPTGSADEPGNGGSVWNLHSGASVEGKDYERW